MIIKARLDDETYLELERLKYEYIATRNILDYLMKQDKINQEDIFEQIIQRAENKKIQLNMYEDELIKLYKPVEYTVTESVIDYDNQCINYTVTEDNVTQGEEPRATISEEDYQKLSFKERLALYK